MKPAKVRNEEALQVIDDYLRWLGTGEFEEVHRVLSNLVAKLSGEPLNAGTPGMDDNCVISSLREQLYRRRHPHPDDLAVDRFAAAMKRKMAKQRDKGYGGWEGPTCTMEFLQDALVDHLPKGDAIDVGNFAMMLWNRGEPTALPLPIPTVSDDDLIAAAVKQASEPLAPSDIEKFLPRWRGFAQEIVGAAVRQISEGER